MAKVLPSDNFPRGKETKKLTAETPEQRAVRNVCIANSVHACRKFGTVNLSQQLATRYQTSDSLCALYRLKFFNLAEHWSLSHLQAYMRIRTFSVRSRSSRIVLHANDVYYRLRSLRSQSPLFLQTHTHTHSLNWTRVFFLSQYVWNIGT